MSGSLMAQVKPLEKDSFMEKRLNLTEEWDKTFPKSKKVDHSKVTFHNRYGITLAADFYTPKDALGKRGGY